LSEEKRILTAKDAKEREGGRAWRPAAPTCPQKRRFLTAKDAKEEKSRESWVTDQ
jgi:hypothetical protein